MGDEMYDGPERRDVTLGDIAESILASAEATTELAKSIDRSTTATERRRTRWLVILSLAVGVCIVMLTYFGYVQWLGTQRGNRIEDCTTPGRECYDRNQEAQRQAIAEVKRDTDAAAQRAADQVACDHGFYCPPGMSPRRTLPGTTVPGGTP